MTYHYQISDIIAVGIPEVIIGAMFGATLGMLEVLTLSSRGKSLSSNENFLGTLALLLFMPVGTVMWLSYIFGLPNAEPDNMDIGWIAAGFVSEVLSLWLTVSRLSARVKEKRG